MPSVRGSLIRSPLPHGRSARPRARMQRSARCIPERTPPGLHIRNPPPDDTLSPVSESRRPTRRAAAFKHRNSALFQQVFEQDRRPTPDGRTALSTGREAAIHDTNGSRRPPSGIGPAIHPSCLRRGKVHPCPAERPSYPTHHPPDAGHGTVPCGPGRIRISPSRPFPDMNQHHTAFFRTAYPRRLRQRIGIRLFSPYRPWENPGFERPARHPKSKNPGTRPMPEYRDRTTFRPDRPPVKDTPPECGAP